MIYDASGREHRRSYGFERSLTPAAAARPKQKLVTDVISSEGFEVDEEVDEVARGAEPDEDV